MILLMLVLRTQSRSSFYHSGEPKPTSRFLLIIIVIWMSTFYDVNNIHFDR
jgi:hypothetical protein